MSKNQFIAYENVFDEMFLRSYVDGRNLIASIIRLKKSKGIKFKIINNW